MNPKSTVAIKPLLVPAALTIICCIVYAASINIGENAINRADIAFIGLAVVALYVMWVTRVFIKKGFETYCALQAQHKAAQSLINSIMNEIPEEEWPRIAEAVAGKAIAEVLGMVCEMEIKPKSSEGQHSTPPS